MSLSRKLLLFTLAVLSSAALSSTALADDPDAAAAMRDRMKSHDKTFYAPPSMSIDQRRLQIAALSAFETQTTDAGVIMQSYLEASMMVTYYLKAETTFSWDGSQWNVLYRTLNTYTDGNLTETLEQDWDGSEWVNQGRTLATWDGDRMSTWIFQIWNTDSSAFINYLKFSYSYTGGGLVSQALSQNWGNGQWQNSTRSTATYNGNIVTEQLTEAWSGVAWGPYSRMLFTYSGSNLTEILTQVFTGAWTNTARTTNTYSGANITQTIYQTWNGSEFVNVSRDDMTYSGSNEILAVGYNWVSNAWTYADSDTSRYDGSNRLIENVTVTMVVGFESVARNLYYYDGAGNMIESTYEFGFFSVWQMATKTVFAYSTSGIFDDEEQAGLPPDFSLDQNYPNPFNQSTLIPYSLAGDSHVRITVTNILGQTVSTVVDEFRTAGSHTASWDGRDGNSRDVPSGIYFFRVQVGQASQVRKMVLLK